MNELSEERFQQIDAMNHDQRVAEYLKAPADVEQWAGIKRMEMRAAHQRQFVQMLSLLQEPPK
jgi:hypothetical protein